MEVFRTNWKSEASQCPIIMCAFITKMLTPLCYHQLSLLYWDTNSDSGVPPTEVHPHMEATSIGGGSCPLLDSAISLTKPNKSPQCDPYQALTGCKNSKLQKYSFCKGAWSQGKNIFLLFLCFWSICYRSPFKIIWKQLREVHK